MKPSDTSFERETLRNLAGPELRMQTDLLPLPRVAYRRVQGGSHLTSVPAGLTSAITETINTSVPTYSAVSETQITVPEGSVPSIRPGVEIGPWINDLD